MGGGLLHMKLAQFRKPRKLGDKKERGYKMSEEIARQLKRVGKLMEKKR